MYRKKNSKVNFSPATTDSHSGMAELHNEEKTDDKHDVDYLLKTF